MPTERLLSSDEVADILDVSQNTLAKWRRTGDQELPYVMVGGLVRYRKSDVDAFLDDLEDDSDDEDEDDDR